MRALPRGSRRASGSLRRSRFESRSQPGAPLPCPCLRHGTARRCFPPSLSLDGTVPAFPLRDEEDLRVREEEEGAAASRQRLPSLSRRCLRASAEGPGQATPRGRQRRPRPGAAGTEEIQHRRAGQGGAVRAGAGGRSRELPGAGADRQRSCEEWECERRSPVPPLGGCGNQACAAKNPFNSANSCPTILDPASSVPSFLESNVVAQGCWGGSEGELQEEPCGHSPARV